MDLKSLRKAYGGKPQQLILLDTSGFTLAVEPGPLKVKPGESLEEVHPFFSCIHALNEIQDDEVSYNCIHLSDPPDSLIVDLKFVKVGNKILLLLQDFTEHYTNYQQVAQSRNESVIQEELTLLRNRELEERERFKDRFIRNFSHELRNPLTTIVSMTQVLARTNLDPGQQEIVQFLQDSNANLQGLLEDILSMSMIASGKLSLQPKIFDFHNLMDHLKLAYETKAKANGLSFTVAIDKRLPGFLEADRLRLYQVLTNLLDNAIKNTAEGSVSLKVEWYQQRAGRVTMGFKVTDTGPGIPENDQKAIFESFTQLQNGARQEGTGLGLSIVTGLLGLMGSEIKLASKSGQGAEFSFNLTLPYPLKKPENLSKLRQRFSGQRKRQGLKGSKFRLLLVEDDERVLTALFKGLMDSGMFYIDVLQEGGRLIQQAIETPYDLILMDVQLPDISGDQLTRLIREIPLGRIRKVPIVGLTAFAYEDELKRFREAGMNAVLTKPVDLDTLVDTLRKFLK